MSRLRTVINTAQDILDGNGGEMVCVSPRATIYDAMNRMAERRVEAILVKEDEELLGIWTAHDFVRNSLGKDLDAKRARVGDYVTKELPTVRHDTPILEIADRLLGQRVRCTLVERGGRCIGILTAGDVIRAALMAGEEKLRKLEGLALLEYTDDWRSKL